MTITQASERFGVSLERLQFYEQNGLFDCHKQPDGTISYCDALMDDVGIIHILLEAGAELSDLRNFLKKLMQSTISKEEKLRFLRRQRASLLHSIHEKQRVLDQLDYLIFDINKLPTGESAKRSHNK